MHKFSLHIGNETKEIKVDFGRIIEPVKCGRQPGKSLEKQLAECFRDVHRHIARKNIPAGSKAVILIDDYTRPTPVDLLLPGLIAIMKSFGLCDITILIAGGFHRRMTDDEVMRKVGVEVYWEFAQNILQHDALDYNRMTCLGETKDGITAYVNSCVTEAAFVVGLGTVEAHPWAGFAGGAKICCPGAAGKITINQTHALPVLKEGARLGSYIDNPFVKNINEVADMAGLDCIINVVLDYRHEILSVRAGEPRQCHKKCIEDYMQHNSLCYPERADIVITTANPKYQYWGQATIAGFNANSVVKKGGTRIVLAACPEGFGDSQREAIFYYESLRNRWDSPKAYWEKAKGEGFENSRNAAAIYRHLEMLGHSDLIMVSAGFPPLFEGLKSLTLIKTVEEALQIAKNRHGKDASIISFDMGAMVLARTVEQKFSF